MKRLIPSSIVASVPLLFGALFYSAPAAANDGVPLGGADLHIHNQTGTDVELYIFEDDSVHRTRAGGAHAGDIHNGETGTAHVKSCHFAIVLFHDKDAYHAEFHDCQMTDITITAANKK